MYCFIKAIPNNYKASYIDFNLVKYTRQWKAHRHSREVKFEQRWILDLHPNTVNNVCLHSGHSNRLLAYVLFCVCCTCLHTVHLFYHLKKHSPFYSFFLLCLFKKARAEDLKSAHVIGQTLSTLCIRKARQVAIPFHINCSKGSRGVKCFKEAAICRVQ